MKKDIKILDDAIAAIETYYMSQSTTYDKNTYKKIGEEIKQRAIKALEEVDCDELVIMAVRNIFFEYINWSFPIEPLNYQEHNVVGFTKNFMTIHQYNAEKNSERFKSNVMQILTILKKTRERILEQKQLNVQSANITMQKWGIFIAAIGSIVNLLISFFANFIKNA